MFMCGLPQAHAAGVEHGRAMLYGLLCRTGEHETFQRAISATSCKQQVGHNR